LCNPGSSLLLEVRTGLGATENRNTNVLTIRRREMSPTAEHGNDARCHARPMWMIRGAGLLSTDPVVRAGLLNRALTLVLGGLSPSGYVTELAAQSPDEPDVRGRNGGAGTVTESSTSRPTAVNDAKERPWS
jgi:hypothetical protein